MIYKILIVSAFFFSSIFSFAQADSLKIIYENAPNDSVRVSALLKWGTLLVKKQPDSAIKLFERGLKLSSKSENVFYKTQRAAIHQNMAVAYGNSGQKEKVMNSYLKSLSLFEELNNEKGIFAVLFNIVDNCFFAGQTTLALEYNAKYLKLSEKYGSKKDIGRAFNFLGLIFRAQGDLEQSLEYFKKAFKLHLEDNDIENQKTTSTNIGVVLYMQKNPALALGYFEKADQLAIKLGDKSEMALTASNLGTIYEKTGNDSMALIYFYKAKQNADDMHDSRFSVGIANNMSDMLIKKGKYEEAEIILEKNIESAKANGYPESISLTAERLMKLYIRKQDYKNAFEMQKLHIVMRDSLNNIETQRVTAKKHAQYEYEKKSAVEKAEFDKQQAISQLELEKRKQSLVFLEQENELKELAISKSKIELKQKGAEAENQQKAIEILNKDVALKEAQSKQKEEELNRQRLTTYSAAGGGGLVLILLIVALKAYKSKKKDNTLIVKQKQEVELQKHLVEEKNKEITDSITYAKRLQEAILPPQKLVKEFLKNSFILYKPKDIVAGDFYWMETKGDVVFYAAADCTGHGVPGAMVSVVCSNAMNRAVKEFGIEEPGKILDKVRMLVIETFEKSESEVKDGMDISLCALNTANGELHWAGANNPLWILRKGSSEIGEIKADKQPIGKMEQMNPFNTHSLNLHKGDTIYIFTDGFVDQFGGDKGKKFKSANFKNLLLTIQNETMEKQKEIIAETFETWKGKLEQIDDVCVIGVQI